MSSAGHLKGLPRYNRVLEPAQVESLFRKPLVSSASFYNKWPKVRSASKGNLLTPDADE